MGFLTLPTDLPPMLPATGRFVEGTKKDIAF